MKSRLSRMRSHARALFVRRLELASDDPLLAPERRRRAERRLRQVKEILKARAYAVPPRLGRSYWVGLNRIRVWIELDCRCCGAVGKVLVEQCWQPEERRVVDRDGPLTLGRSGRTVCLDCWSRADAHPKLQ